MKHIKEVSIVSSKKEATLKFIGILVMLVANMALFYNASIQDTGSDSSDLPKGNVDWLSLVLTLVLGISQGIEIRDHAMGHNHDHGHAADTESAIIPPRTETEHHDYKIESHSPDDHQEESVSLGKIVLRSAIPLALGGFSCYAIWGQANSFAQGSLAISIPLFIPNIVRFILLPGRHMKALVMGTEHELMHEVTDTHDVHEEKVHISPYKKAGLFLLFGACHIADSQLLANQVKQQPVIYWLSTIGLSGSVACYHVTHSLNIKAAYKEFQKLSRNKKCIALILAFSTGGLHASQSMLGLMHLINTQQPLFVLGAQGVATLVEGITGSIDAMQHVSMWATKSSTRHQAGEKDEQLLTRDNAIN